MVCYCCFLFVCWIVFVIGGGKEEVVFVKMMNSYSKETVVCKGMCIPIN